MNLFQKLFLFPEIILKTDLYSHRKNPFLKEISKIDSKIGFKIDPKNRFQK